jgi:hypothetical protein
VFAAAPRKTSAKHICRRCFVAPFHLSRVSPAVVLFDPPSACSSIAILHERDRFQFSHCFIRARRRAHPRVVFHRRVFHSRFLCFTRAFRVSPSLSVFHPRFPCFTLAFPVSPALSVFHLAFRVSPALPVFHPRFPCFTLAFGVSPALPVFHGVPVLLDAISRPCSTLDSSRRVTRLLSTGMRHNAAPSEPRWCRARLRRRRRGPHNNLLAKVAQRRRTGRLSNLVAKVERRGHR